MTESTKKSTAPANDKASEEIIITHEVLASKQACKLSPKAEGSLHYDIGLSQSEPRCLAIRITGNTSGGYFSKEWIPLTEIEACLSGLPDGDAFKSSAFKPIYQASSANNAGFLCAALRAEKVLAASGKGPFLHTKGLSVRDWAKTLEDTHTADSKKVSAGKPAGKLSMNRKSKETP